MPQVTDSLYTPCRQQPTCLK